MNELILPPGNTLKILSEIQFDFCLPLSNRASMSCQGVLGLSMLLMTLDVV